MKVLVFEYRDVHGPGLAYDSPPKHWIMNGMASRLSAIDEVPDHFVKWLSRSVHSDQSLDVSMELGSHYAGRREYGRYIEDLLKKGCDQVANRVALSMVRGSVIRMEAKDQKFHVYTSCGTLYVADAVVLAIGNQPPRRVFHQLGTHFVEDPWRYSAWAQIDPKAPLLLVGTSQTMMDIVCLLVQMGHSGPIWAISRHGLLPHSQASCDGRYSFDRQSLPSGLTSLIRYLRDSAISAARQNANWRDVLIAFRPLIQKHWTQLSLGEQMRFFRHVLPYWRIHRTRVSPQTRDTVLRAIASGQLTVFAARLKSVIEKESGIHVSLTPRGQDHTIELLVEMAINCTGPNNNYADLEDPLVKQLLTDGWIVPHPNGVGLHVQPSGAVIDRRGKTPNRFYAVGPPCEGTLLECTVIREIRVQAAQVARSILRELSA